MGHPPARDQRAADVHRRSHPLHRRQGPARPAEAGGLPVALPCGLPDRGGRGQGQLPARGRRPATGQGVRRDPAPEVRLRDQRHRDHRVRLHHRHRTHRYGVPRARGPVAPPALRRGDRRRRCRPKAAHSHVARPRAAASLLPGDRRQPGDPGRPAGASANPAHTLHGLREDRDRLPDLLETLVRALEPHGRCPPAQDPVPCGPQRAGGRPHGQGLQPVRRRAAQDLRNGGQEPRHVLRHLPGDRSR